MPTGGLERSTGGKVSSRRTTSRSLHRVPLHLLIPGLYLYQRRLSVPNLLTLVHLATRPRRRRSRITTHIAHLRRRSTGNPLMALLHSRTAVITSLLQS